MDSFKAMEEGFIYADWHKKLFFVVKIYYPLCDYFIVSLLSSLAKKLA